MSPRPVYKSLAAVLYPFIVFGLFWVWFSTAPEPQPYYLSYRSWFLYERLLLPRLPPMPFSTPEPEHHKLLGYLGCGGVCVATPESVKQGKPAAEFAAYVPTEKAKQLLDRNVYHGGITRAMWWPILLDILLFPVMLIGSIVLDFKRRKRLMRGAQLAGRWTVPPERFSGFFSRFKTKAIRIDVEKPHKERTA